MNRIEDRDEDMIDLGAASEETRGGALGNLDSIKQRDFVSGISDD